MVQVNQVINILVLRTAKDSSRTHETFVCISKSAGRDFVLFIESVYLQCILAVFFLCEKESILPLDGL